MVYTVVSWLLALLSVVPFTGFVRYLDIETESGNANYRDIAFCFIYEGANIEDVFRATFFLIFLIPSVVMLIFLVRTSWELSYQRRATTVCTCDVGCLMREKGYISSARAFDDDECSTASSKKHGHSNGKHHMERLDLRRVSDRADALSVRISLPMSFGWAHHILLNLFSQPRELGSKNYWQQEKRNKFPN